jgi:hypothetical protein
MISTLPKLADRNFVVGFLLPALLAVTAAAWVFPEFSALAPLRTPSISDKQLSDLAYVVLTMWLAGVLLMAANHTMYRMLEGYLPPVSWLAPLRVWHRRRFRKLRRQHDAAMAKWTEAERAGEHSSRGQLESARLRLRLLAHYPDDEAEVLPTAFGNVLRAFEVYPRQVYGADAIPVWLRLVSVVPKDYAAQVNGARAQVDCFVNIAFLSAGLALGALAAAAVYTIADTATGQDTIRRIIAAAIAIVVSLLSYRSAVARAMLWGDTVKATFDCYLPALVAQLGYAVPPTEAERRAFWEDFNEKVLYRYPMTRDWTAVGKANEGKAEQVGNAVDSEALKEGNETAESGESEALSN